VCFSDARAWVNLPSVTSDQDDPVTIDSSANHVRTIEPSSHRPESTVDVDGRIVEALSASE